MTLIEYNGEANTRRITEAQLDAAGFTVPYGLTWNKANNYELDVADPALVAWLLAQGGQFATEDSASFVGAANGLIGSMSPALALRTVGNISLVNTAGIIVELPTVGDTLDRVVERVSPGQWIELFMDGVASNSANNAYLTFCPVVDDVLDNTRMVKPPLGPHGWRCEAGEYSALSGWYPHQLTEDDISADGSVTMRPCYMGAGAKTLYADGSNSLTIGARGPF